MKPLSLKPVGVKPFLPFARPSIDADSIAAVADVLRSGVSPRARTWVRVCVPCLTPPRIAARAGNPGLPWAFQQFVDAAGF